MKLFKSAVAATVVAGTVAIASAQFGGSQAVAQTTTTTPAQTAAQAAAAAIPSHPGSFNGGKVDALTYTASCPVFVIGMDAAAIQESSSRAYVEGEARRFEQLRERWDAYEDCLTENARRDIEAVRTKLGDALSKAAADEAAAFNGFNTAATTNIDRISRLPATKAPKLKKGEVAPVVAAIPLSAWTKPEGRFVGSLTGPTSNLDYASGCPNALGVVTADSFATANSRDGFNALLDELRAMPERINDVRACRQANGQDDYEAIQAVVQTGVNAVFVPRKQAFEREYAAIRFQLNEHRKAGGLLAPPELTRRPAPTKAKKKK